MKSFLSGTIFFPEKPSKEELEFYKQCYENAQTKEGLFYQTINNGHSKMELENAACNFLLYLNLFNVGVPKKVRQKEFKDFKKTKDLAKIILTESLNRIKSRCNSRL